MEEVEKRDEESHDGMLEGGVEVRVLVVDDSPVDRRMVEVLLKKSGAMFQGEPIIHTQIEAHQFLFILFPSNHSALL